MNPIILICVIIQVMLLLYCKSISFSTGLRWSSWSSQSKYSSVFLFYLHLISQHVRSIMFLGCPIFKSLYILRLEIGRFACRLCKIRTIFKLWEQMPIVICGWDNHLFNSFPRGLMRTSWVYFKSHVAVKLEWKRALWTILIIILFIILRHFL
jgi:hypothetical protein